LHLHAATVLKSITRTFSHCEQEHSPLTLPADLKSLYAFSDGMLVRWQVKYGGLFCIRELNSHDSNKAIALSHFSSIRLPTNPF
jgi:hypothetical protein